jgi:hypothetical protein
VSDIKDVGEYCREIETYLCQKNEGHLIRIVGPAFERVCGWAARGVPLKIAFRGIDRYCERYYTKGPRRRPVRIEFCEADILDAFDDWRRAVGVAAAGNGTAEPARKPSLASHIERVTERLTSLQGGGTRPAEFVEEIGRAVRELDELKGEAQHARGDRRKEIVAELDRLDRAIVEAAAGGVTAGAAAALEREAEAELTPFAARMTAEAYAAAKRAAYARLLRDVAGLPVIRYE